MDVGSAIANFNWAMYKPYLTYGPYILILIVWTIWGKYFKLLFNIRRMKKQGKNPILIHMRFIDGTSDLFVFDKSNEQFQVNGRTYHFATQSDFYSRNKFFNCPEEWHVEEQVEPIDPYLYKKVYATEVLPEHQIIDKNGKVLQTLKNVRLIPILPNRIDPKKYDTLLLNMYKLGRDAAQSKESLIVTLALGALCVAGASAYIGYLDYKHLEAIKATLAGLQMCVVGA